MDDVTRGVDSLLVVSIVAALAPFVAGLLPGSRIPQVVIMIVGGIIVGPQVLGLAETQSIELFTNVGLGFVFLLAGYELDLAVIRESAGRLALLAWAITAVLALGVVGLLEATGLVRAFVPIAIALTTTALGTLLPILRDNDMLSGRFGRYVLAAGATGELLPIIAVALFLSANNSFVAIISLVSMGGLAFILAFAPRILRGRRRLAEIFVAGEHATSQITLRLSIVLLIALIAISARFGLDVVLGAFLAGVVLHRWAPGDVRALEGNLDAVGYGFFIPVFFISSGMGLNVRSIIEAPLRLLVFFALFLMIRGLPALLVYRHALSRTERLQMAFITATTLPLLVALAEIGLRNGTMLPENAAALVGAGVLTVMVYPAVAVAIGSRQEAKL